MVNAVKFGTVEVKSIHVTEPRKHWLETQPVITVTSHVSDKDRKEYKTFLAKSEKRQKIGDTLVLRTDFPDTGVLQVSSNDGKFRSIKGVEEALKIFGFIKTLVIPKALLKGTPFKSDEDVKLKLAEYLIKSAAQKP